MVHTGGFEPPYVIDGQIYSLLPLTTRPPVHFAANPVYPAVPQLIKSRVDHKAADRAGRHPLKKSPESAWPERPDSTTKSNLFAAWKLELAKGLEPPTL